MPASDVLAGLPLVDHHCHGVLLTELDRAGVERGLTESDAPAPPGTTMFDTPVGLAVRRWCAPVLGLEPHADAAAYLAVRARLGTAESTRRLLRAALLSDVLVDTGLRGPDLSSPAELAEAAGARGHVVVRLESVAEDVARAGTTAASFADDFGERLRRASAGAVAVKSIAAYRCGLDLPGHRPHDSEVRRAAAAWLVQGEQEGRWRLRDARVVRHCVWAGLDLGLPLQIHTGFGDRDVRLHRSDPALLADFLAAVEPAGVPVVLLHCHPYHRQAAWLAQVFPHVHADVGLALNHVGAGAPGYLAECLELTPFAKLLFSTDAFGLPELFCTGAALFREAFGRVLDSWIAHGACSTADAERIARLVGAANARRVYWLESR